MVGTRALTKTSIFDKIGVKGKTMALKKEIDYEQFERMCEIQCTEEEMAHIFRISTDTLESRIREHYGLKFSEAYKKFSDAGKESLRRYQFNLAKTNATMAIFLGKQWLGQKDEAVNSANVKIELGSAEKFAK